MTVRAAVGLAMALALVAAVPPIARAQRCAAGERPRATPPLAEGGGLVGFDGRDFFLLGAGGRLARIDACTGRWRPLAGRGPGLDAAHVVQTDDGALVLTPSGSTVIR